MIDGEETMLGLEADRVPNPPGCLIKILFTDSPEPFLFLSEDRRIAVLGVRLHSHHSDACQLHTLLCRLRLAGCHVEYPGDIFGQIEREAATHRMFALAGLLDEMDEPKETKRSRKPRAKAKSPQKPA